MRCAPGFHDVTRPSGPKLRTASGEALITARNLASARRVASARAVRVKLTMSAAAIIRIAAAPIEANAATTLAAAESQYRGFHTVTISRKCVSAQLTMNTPKAQKKP